MLKAASTGNEEKDGVDGKDEPKQNGLSVENGIDPRDIWKAV